MQRRIRLATFVAMVWIAACQLREPTVSDPDEREHADRVGVEPAIERVRLVMGHELGIEVGEAPKAEWTDTDRDHLHTFLLALEIHEVWGVGDETAVRGQYTPQLADHLWRRIAVYEGSEPAMVIADLLEHLDVLVDAGIVVDR